MIYVISVENKIKRELQNFWGHCHFHPTDAIEDAWGKQIIERFRKDGAIQTVRMYAMLEDIVYMDEYGELCYDFRINDLRLDYMVEQGFNILLSYNFMPECLASDKNSTSNVCKNATRYKGKLINTSAPTDYALWEEVCYQYTKHIVERYGVEVVSKWYLQCWNEPDIAPFFLTKLGEDAVEPRLEEYCKLYTGFVKGVSEASPKLRMGGMGLATSMYFLNGFLQYVKSNDLRLDYISLHNYGMTPFGFKSGKAKFCVQNQLDVYDEQMQVLTKNGFAHKELVYDEWGAVTGGFVNRETVSELMFRETEVFSAYYARLIHAFIHHNASISKMLICLSGQHEMTEDFSGFRNFFTLNFYAKPIYNAYILASKLKSGLVDITTSNPNIYAIPTKSEAGEYSVMLTYCSENFEEDLPELQEELTFGENIEGKRVRVYCIDKQTTNPYRLSERKDASVSELREEGRLKPIMECQAKSGVAIPLSLTANCVYLIEVTA